MCGFRFNGCSNNCGLFNNRFRTNCFRVNNCAFNGRGFNECGHNNCCNDCDDTILFDEFRRFRDCD